MAADAARENQRAAFRALEQRLAGRDAGLDAHRRAAFARFLELGFPTTRMEDWRSTNLAPIAETPWRPPEGDGPADPAPGRLPLADLPGPRLTFVDGRFHRGLSHLPPVDGLTVRGLGEALAEDSAALLARLGALPRPAAHPFLELADAFLEDGALVVVEPRAVVREPVHLLFLETASEEPVAVQARILVAVGELGSLTLVESHAPAASGASRLANVVTGLELGPGAILEHLQLLRPGADRFHLSLAQARQARGSSFTSRAFVLGGRITRHDVRVALDGEGAACALEGLYAATERQHVECRTLVDHARPHCSSSQLYKGVLGGRSRGAFTGKVVVRPDAQKTDARQSNRNLLLSERALADTQPQLEIHADDVKCTHGATIGQLDDDALFYLRSRGIDAAAARSMLTRAFAGEMIDRVGLAAVREEIDALSAAVTAVGAEPEP